MCISRGQRSGTLSDLQSAHLSGAPGSRLLSEEWRESSPGPPLEGAWRAGSKNTRCLDSDGHRWLLLSSPHAPRPQTSSPKICKVGAAPFSREQKRTPPAAFRGPHEPRRNTGQGAGQGPCGLRAPV
uniref:Uncharacterized protein n=1 Tax=Molossus molossus TaxID=27622 RepID=A0A7J8HHJ2_MOLMO|nr:hypothetical protein HJG59_010931 [Molossus molossus]